MCRARPFGNQALDQQFFMKEHSKPLFNEKKLLTVHNLYTYHSITETFAILKFRSPISMFTLFHLSSRKETLLIIPQPNHHLHFVHNSTSTWNAARQKLEVTNFSTKYSLIKSATKKLLLGNQNLGEDMDWIAPNFEFA